jgi:hypothetical protein
LGKPVHAGIGPYDVRGEISDADRLLIGWIVFSYLFAEFALVAFMGIAYLIGYLFLCLWQVLKLALRACFLGLRHGARDLCLGLMLAFYIVDEWRRGRSAPAHPDTGGTAEDAQAVNAAYDIVLQAHGWPR